MAAKKERDVLLGRRVEINESAAYAGAKGTITKALKGSQYEVELRVGSDGGEPATTTYTFALSEFTVLHDNDSAGVPSTLVEADPYLVAFSLDNPRRRRGLDVESIAALAGSIKAQGLAQPILVRPLPGSRAQDTFQAREEGRQLPAYELVCGERRLRASRIAGMSAIPMMIRDLSDDQALELQLVENIEREDLDPLEEAEGFELLRAKLGYSVEQIAERIGKGKSRDYVYKTMKLLQLTPESREAVYEGHLGRSTGLLVARYPAERQAEVVAFIKSLAVRGEPATFREVEPKVFTRFNLDLRNAVFEIADETLVPAAGSCTACPKRTGATADLFGEGDANPDSCTDADCFAGKRAAHVERVKADAKKQGLEVIDGEEAKEAIPSPHMSWIKGYTQLADTVVTERGDDGVEREVTFEDALRSRGRKAPKPQVLINPHTGAAIKVIPENLADELREEQLRRQGQPRVARGGARQEPPADDRPEDVRALDDYNVRRAVTMRIFEAVRNRDRTDAEVLLMAKVMFASSDENAPPLITTFLNWEADLDGVDYEDMQGVVNAKLDALPPAEIAAIATMVAIELATYSLGEGHATHLQLAAAYGVDVLAVRDKVVEDESRHAGESFVEGAERIAAEAGGVDANDDQEDEADAVDQAAAQIDQHRAAWPFPLDPKERAKRAQEA